MTGERKVVYKLDHQIFGFEKKAILDGMVTDTKGNLWVVIYLAGKILNIDVETGKEIITKIGFALYFCVAGKVINSITIDTPCITSLCFGGKHLSELFVTSCSVGLSGWSDHANFGDNGGHTFRVICEKDNCFKGFNPNCFHG